MEEIEKLRKRRRVFRRNATIVINKLHEELEGEHRVVEAELKTYQIELKESKDELKALDKEILRLLLDGEDEDSCDKEVQETRDYNKKLEKALVSIEMELGKSYESRSNASGHSSRISRTASNESLNSIASKESLSSIASKENLVSIASGESDASNSSERRRRVTVKLPKLEIQKFAGQIHQWEEFWDGFCSAIHENDDLAQVDKLKYLKSFLVEPAKSVISGLKITESNYNTAVALLKKRYAKPSVIQHAHINQLINLTPVFSEDNISRLKFFRDQIETHFRGLEALNVNKESYSTFVVPILMEKLPKEFRIGMVRSMKKGMLEWSLDELVSALDEEMEVRESHDSLLKPVRAVDRPKQQKQPVSTASMLFTPEEKFQKCCFCKQEGHQPSDCVIKEPEERKNILMKSFKCFLCLKGGHRSFECHSKLRCKLCRAKHNSLICTANRPKSSSGSCKESSDREGKSASAPNNVNSASMLNVNAPIWTGSTGSGNSVALQTALAKVNERKECTVRVLFDTGSHKSFITARAVETLGLRPVSSEKLAIKAFGSNESEEKIRDVVECSLSSLRGGEGVKIQCYVVNEITDIVNEHIEIVKKSYSHLQKVWFSDVARHQDTLCIDILIGSDFFWNFQAGETIRGGPDEPVAVKTSLGWVLSGPLKGKKLSSVANVNFLPSTEKRRVEIDVNKLWNLDTLGIRPESEVQEFFVDNIVFTGDRYSVSLPWKAGHGPIPCNYTNSLMRLKSQVKKLKQVPEILAKYDEIILEQIEMGIVSKVSALDTPGKVSYLPHSAVVRENAETTKVRVVYDASCRDKQTGTSLNDCLHVGPSLSPLIFDILLRFRGLKVALVGDIEKAFLNIEVDPADRNCLRFLWLDDLTKEDPEIIVLVFNRVCFGVNSSPYLLNAVLRHHLSTFENVDPVFVKKLSQSFYVDDLVTGAPNIEEACTLYVNAKERLKKGGFQLRKWKTNDETVREMICQNEKAQHCEKNEKEEELTYAKETLQNSEVLGGKTKVLGIIWDNDKDNLEFDLTKLGKNVESQRPSKRGILSTLAMLFDPLGLISPTGICVKIIFQELCVEKLDWDDPLPEEKVARWEAWLRDLDNVKTISIPRCVFSQTDGNILSYELHGFGDASQKAYCAVVYLVYRTNEGISTKLMCSKSRVAPLKNLSIPRLELLSARILAVLMSNVIKALESQFSISRVRYWLDSKTALYWVYNQGEWKQWVQFRVAEILKLSQKDEWNHVSGSENPTDLGSRGVSSSFLSQSKLWWEGPEWLQKGENFWPNNVLLEDSQVIANERKKVNVMSIVSSEKGSIGKVMDVRRFNSLKKLIRVTAYVKRFIQNLKQKKRKGEIMLGTIKVEEIEYAERMWIKDAQELLRNKADFQKTKTSLGAIEMEGLLVCKGRLENSDLEVGQKFPIILPKEHKLTELIVLDCHKKVHHCKVGSTLAELRSRFWVTKGRQFVKKLLSACFVCKKLEGKPFESPPEAALPYFRVTEAPPFSCVGVDFAGPLMVKEENGLMRKCYIVLFSCCVTRAVHVELVRDLVTTTFLNCFRKFCARRGTPRMVISDNGKTFKAANRVLHKLLSEKPIDEMFVARHILWKFNLERTPWWGGHFERMIGTIKRCLRKVLGNARLSFDELSTVLAEVESTINSRPLTYSYEEIGEKVLTPSHLILGRRLSPLSEFVDLSIDLNEEITPENLSRRFMYIVGNILRN